MSRIYSNNFRVAKEAANLLKNFHITRFHSQNALYIFMEDIKNPWIKNSGYFKSKRAAKLPGYHGDKNYGPIISYLQKHDVLVYKTKKKSNSGWILQYEIEVDKDALDCFIETHKNKNFNEVQ